MQPYTELYRDTFEVVSPDGRSFDLAHVNTLPASYEEQRWVQGALRYVGHMAEVEQLEAGAGHLDTPEQIAACRYAAQLRVLAEGARESIEAELAAATVSAKEGVTGLLRDTPFGTEDVTARPKALDSILAKIGRRIKAQEKDTISDGVALTLYYPDGTPEADRRDVLDYLRIRLRIPEKDQNGKDRVGMTSNPDSDENYIGVPQAKLYARINGAVVLFEVQASTREIDLHNSGNRMRYDQRKQLNLAIGATACITQPTETTEAG